MRLLRLGSIGPSVQLLQLALGRAGFGELVTDGIFGSATKAALMRFQKAGALYPDGVAGAQTHRTLMPWYTGFTVHSVRAGESVWSIARRYGSSVDAILTANPSVVPLDLRVGTRLTVPLGFDVVPTGIDYCSALVALCIRGLTARYPFLVAGELGRSVMGKALWRLSLGYGENRVLYTAAHHANEWITAPLLLRFCEELARGYAFGGTVYDRSAKEILEYASIYLVPAVDPDGIDLVTGELTDGDYYRAAVGIAEKYPRYPFPAGWKANIRGTDLNLQYPAGWEQARKNKFEQGIRSPAPADYVGSAPLSAPESRALYTFTQALDPSLVLAYHTQGEVIYWRYLDYEPQGSREIAELFSRLSGYSAEDTPFASGFAGYKDWFIESFGRPGFTVEAGKGTNPLPISDFEELYRKNLGILTYGALVT